MSNDDFELLQRIVKNEPREIPEEDRVQRAVARWYEGHRNHAIILSMVYIILSVIPLVWGLRLLGSGAEDTRLLVLGLAAMTFALSINVLIKLWYWIVDTKISIVKDLKLLQLRFANSDEANTGESVDSETLSKILPDNFFTKRRPLLERFNIKHVRWIVILGCILAAGPSLMFADKTLQAAVPGTGIAQADVWHFNGTGQIQVESTLMVDPTAQLKSFVTVTPPYAPAELESVLCDGLPLSFSRLDWRRFEVQLPPEPFPATAQTILVKWSFPESLVTSSAPDFRASLGALMPVDAYSLEIELIEESGFEFLNDSSATRIQPFKATWHKPGQYFGSCGTLLKAIH